MSVAEDVRHARRHTQYRTKDNVLVPGVTTVLNVLAKPALIRWANRIGLEGYEVDKYVDHTALIGKLAHEMIQAELAGRQADVADYSPNQHEAALRAVEKWRAWTKRHELQPLLVERPLISEKHGFGGTPDCYGRFDGRLTVIDFKTSKAIYDDHVVQAAAYAQLLGENGCEVAEIRIVQVGRVDAEGFSERTVEDWSRHLELFLHALAIYRLQREIRAA